ncbi:hypothetical protein JHK86_050220 [Glycine max]|nr:hypothetical protein JHK86_050220 [Glycine max]
MFFNFLIHTQTYYVLASFSKFHLYRKKTLLPLFCNILNLIFPCCWLVQSTNSVDVVEDVLIDGVRTLPQNKLLLELEMVVI